MPETKLLNLGCGSSFNKNWTNVDFVSHSNHVISHNLQEGIPFPDSSFTFVYHSHVLEHFPKSKAKAFLDECYRVLIPGGIIRVVIPDLEAIASNYIRYLNESMSGVAGAAEKYDWTMLELYDQTVRSRSGGQMIDYIRDSSHGNDDFLIERNGMEVVNLMRQLRGEGHRRKSTLAGKISSAVAPRNVHELLIRIVLGRKYDAYVEGNFRGQGEIHQWMYDRYSLKLLLEVSGFESVQTMSASESSLACWNSQNLDMEEGKVRKPDSLFVEAFRPT